MTPPSSFAPSSFSSSNATHKRPLVVVASWRNVAFLCFGFGWIVFLANPYTENDLRRQQPALAADAFQYPTTWLANRQPAQRISKSLQRAPSTHQQRPWRTIFSMMMVWEWDTPWWKNPEGESNRAENDDNNNHDNNNEKDMAATAAAMKELDRLQQEMVQKCRWMMNNHVALALSHSEHDQLQSLINQLEQQLPQQRQQQKQKQEWASHLLELARELDQLQQRFWINPQEKEKLGNAPPDSTSTTNTELDELSQLSHHLEQSIQQATTSTAASSLDRGNIHYSRPPSSQQRRHDMETSTSSSTLDDPLVERLGELQDELDSLVESLNHILQQQEEERENRNDVDSLGGEHEQPPGDSNLKAPFRDRRPDEGDDGSGGRRISGQGGTRQQFKQEPGPQLIATATTTTLRKTAAPVWDKRSTSTDWNDTEHKREEQQDHFPTMPTARYPSEQFRHATATTTTNPYPMYDPPYSYSATTTQPLEVPTTLESTLEILPILEEHEENAPYSASPSLTTSFLSTTHQTNKNSLSMKGNFWDDVTQWPGVVEDEPKASDKDKEGSRFPFPFSSSNGGGNNDNNTKPPPNNSFLGGGGGRNNTNAKNDNNKNNDDQQQEPQKSRGQAKSNRAAEAPPPWQQLLQSMSGSSSSTDQNKNIANNNNPYYDKQQQQPQIPRGQTQNTDASDAPPWQQLLQSMGGGRSSTDENKPKKTAAAPQTPKNNVEDTFPKDKNYNMTSFFPKLPSLGAFGAGDANVAAKKLPPGQKQKGTSKELNNPFIPKMPSLGNFPNPMTSSKQASKTLTEKDDKIASSNQRPPWLSNNSFSKSWSPWQGRQSPEPGMDSQPERRQPGRPQPPLQPPMQQRQQLLDSTSSSFATTKSQAVERPRQWQLVQEWVDQSRLPRQWAVLRAYSADPSMEVSVPTLMTSPPPPQFFPQNRAMRLPKRWAAVKAWGLATAAEESGVVDLTSLPKQWALLQQWTILQQILNSEEEEEKLHSQEEDGPWAQQQRPKLPDRYQVVMYWAQRQKVPPTMNQLLFLLRCQKVAATAIFGKSRWGIPEIQRSVALTASMWQEDEDSTASRIAEPETATTITPTVAQVSSHDNHYNDNINKSVDSALRQNIPNMDTTTAATATQMTTTSIAPSQTQPTDGNTRVLVTSSKSPSPPTTTPIGQDWASMNQEKEEESSSFSFSPIGGNWQQQQEPKGTKQQDEKRIEEKKESFSPFGSSWQPQTTSKEQDEKKESPNVSPFGSSWQPQAKDPKQLGEKKESPNVSPFGSSWQPQAKDPKQLGEKKESPNFSPFGSSWQPQAKDPKQLGEKKESPTFSPLGSSWQPQAKDPKQLDEKKKTSSFSPFGSSWQPQAKDPEQQDEKKQPSNFSPFGSSWQPKAKDPIQLDEKKESSSFSPFGSTWQPKTKQPDEQRVEENKESSGVSFSPFGGNRQQQTTVPKQQDQQISPSPPTETGATTRSRPASDPPSVAKHASTTTSRKMTTTTTTTTSSNNYQLADDLVSRSQSNDDSNDPTPAFPSVSASGRPMASLNSKTKSPPVSSETKSSSYKGDKFASDLAAMGKSMDDLDDPSPRFPSASTSATRKGNSQVSRESRTKTIEHSSKTKATTNAAIARSKATINPIGSTSTPVSADFPNAVDKVEESTAPEDSSPMALYGLVPPKPVAPLPPMKIKSALSLFDLRNLKVASAAAAGRSRWGDSENRKVMAMAVLTSSAPLKRPQPILSKMRDSAAVGSWRKGEIQKKDEKIARSRSPSSPTSPSPANLSSDKEQDMHIRKIDPDDIEGNAATPFIWYLERTVKVARAASVGKSRWGTMENNRAKQMAGAVVVAKNKLEHRDQSLGPSLDRSSPHPQEAVAGISRWEPPNEYRKLYETTGAIALDRRDQRKVMRLTPDKAQTGPKESKQVTSAAIARGQQQRQEASPAYFQRRSSTEMSKAQETSSPIMQRGSSSTPRSSEKRKESLWSPFRAGDQGSMPIERPRRELPRRTTEVRKFGSAIPANQWGSDEIQSRQQVRLGSGQSTAPFLYHRRSMNVAKAATAGRSRWGPSEIDIAQQVSDAAIAAGINSIPLASQQSTEVDVDSESQSQEVTVPDQSGTNDTYRGTQAIDITDLTMGDLNQSTSPYIPYPGSAVEPKLNQTTPQSMSRTPELRSEVEESKKTRSEMPDVQSRDVTLSPQATATEKRGSDQEIFSQNTDASTSSGSNASSFSPWGQSWMQTKKPNEDLSQNSDNFESKPSPFAPWGGSWMPTKLEPRKVDTKIEDGRKSGSGSESKPSSFSPWGGNWKQTKEPASEAKVPSKGSATSPSFESTSSSFSPWGGSWMPTKADADSKDNNVDTNTEESTSSESKPFSLSSQSGSWKDAPQPVKDNTIEATDDVVVASPGTWNVTSAVSVQRISYNEQLANDWASMSNDGDAVDDPSPNFPSTNATTSFSSLSTPSLPSKPNPRSEVVADKGSDEAKETRSEMPQVQSTEAALSSLAVADEVDNEKLITIQDNNASTSSASNPSSFSPWGQRWMQTKAQNEDQSRNLDKPKSMQNEDQSRKSDKPESITSGSKPSSFTPWGGSWMPTKLEPRKVDTKIDDSRKSGSGSESKQSYFSPWGGNWKQTKEPESEAKVPSKGSDTSPSFESTSSSFSPWSGSWMPTKADADSKDNKIDTNTEESTSSESKPFSFSPQSGSWKEAPERVNDNTSKATGDVLVNSPGTWNFKRADPVQPLSYNEQLANDWASMSNNGDAVDDPSPNFPSTNATTSFSSPSTPSLPSKPNPRSDVIADKGSDEAKETRSEMPHVQSTEATLSSSAAADEMNQDNDASTSAASNPSSFSPWGQSWMQTKKPNEDQSPNSDKPQRITSGSKPSSFTPWGGTWMPTKLEPRNVDAKIEDGSKSGSGFESKPSSFLPWGGNWKQTKEPASEAKVPSKGSDTSPSFESTSSSFSPWGGSWMPTKADADSKDNNVDTNTEESTSSESKPFSLSSQSGSWKDAPQPVKDNTIEATDDVVVASPGTWNVTSAVSVQRISYNEQLANDLSSMSNDGDAVDDPSPNFPSTNATTSFSSPSTPSLPSKPNPRSEVVADKGSDEAKETRSEMPRARSTEAVLSSLTVADEVDNEKLITIQDNNASTSAASNPSSFSPWGQSWMQTKKPSEDPTRTSDEVSSITSESQSSSFSPWRGSWMPTKPKLQKEDTKIEEGSKSGSSSESKPSSFSPWGGSWFQTKESENSILSKDGDTSVRSESKVPSFSPWGGSWMQSEGDPDDSDMQRTGKFINDTTIGSSAEWRSGTTEPALDSETVESNLASLPTEDSRRRVDADQMFNTKAPPSLLTSTSGLANEWTSANGTAMGTERVNIDLDSSGEPSSVVSIDEVVAEWAFRNQDSGGSLAGTDFQLQEDGSEEDRSSPLAAGPSYVYSDAKSSCSDTSAMAESYKELLATEWASMSTQSNSDFDTSSKQLPPISSLAPSMDELGTPTIVKGESGARVGDASKATAESSSSNAPVWMDQLAKEWIDMNSERKRREIPLQTKTDSYSVPSEFADQNEVGSNPDDTNNPYSAIPALELQVLGQWNSTPEQLEPEKVDSWQEEGQQGIFEKAFFSARSSMEQFSRKWVNTNTDTKTLDGRSLSSESAPSTQTQDQSSPHSTVNRAKSGEINWERGLEDNEAMIAKQPPSAVPEQGDMLQFSYDDLSSASWPQEGGLPKSYENVLAWAAKQTVPPTLNNVIYHLRNHKVAFYAAEGKSRWGPLENLRSNYLVSVIRGATADAAVSRKDSDVHGMERGSMAQLSQEWAAMNRGKNNG
ncbi:hypothetical protein ACA910_021375 [Epithemia clementina (nom. ined.)]